MVGGYKNFGPTYNSTPYLRLGIEGTLNGNHPISTTLLEAAPVANGEAHAELAGKIAAMTADGVGLCKKGAGAVGLFREDLQDMVNASYKATFYFRGGEYYVAQSRTGIADFTTIAVGDELTTNDKGELVKLTDATTEKAVGVAIYKGEYRNGNMYEWAGATANGGLFLGFILYM